MGEAGGGGILAAMADFSPLSNAERVGLGPSVVRWEEDAWEERVLEERWLWPWVEVG